MTNEFIDRLRPFAGQDDLETILQAVGDWNVLADECGYLHFGDVCHFFSNGLRGQDPARFVFLCEGDDGLLLALVLLWPPRVGGFNVMVAPAGRSSDLERDLLVWAAQQTRELAQESNVEPKHHGAEVMDCDVIRQDLLVGLGFVAGAATFAYTSRSLLDPVPDPVLPEGFSIRNDLTIADVAALSEVHSGAFNSDWSNGAYKTVMESPGYHYGHELVVVAPDGRFAAFLIYWPDATTQSALFEPVGCHPDFQRMGLTRALMYDAMKRMIALNMHGARVNHEIDNPASAGLYAAVGFKRKYTIMEYNET